MIEKSLDASLLFSIINLTSQIRLRGDLIYRFAGLTTQQYVILLHLAGDPNIPFIEERTKEEGMYASELAESLKLSRPGVTNLLKALIQKGFVSQMEDKEDRRKKRLYLTEEGVKLIQAIEPLRRKANAAFLDQFSESEKEQFMAYIRRCATYAKDQLDQPADLLEMYQRLPLD